MAIVRDFSNITKNRVGRVSEVSCGYTKVTVGEQELLLLETYGSTDRKIHGKVSQSIHLDRDGAVELKRILEQPSRASNAPVSGELLATCSASVRQRA